MAWDSSLGTPQKRNKSLKARPNFSYLLYHSIWFSPSLLILLAYNSFFCITSGIRVVGKIFLRRWDMADHAVPGWMGPMYALQQVRFVGRPIFYWTGWYNQKKGAVFIFRALLQGSWHVCFIYVHHSPQNFWAHFLVPTKIGIDRWSAQRY